MGNIYLSSAPQIYKKYLELGDNQGDKNQTINSSTEAEKSFEGYCLVNTTENSQKFLEYLEQNNYIISKPLLSECKNTNDDNDIDLLLDKIGEILGGDRTVAREFLAPFALKGILKTTKIIDLIKIVAHSNSISYSNNNDIEEVFESLIQLKEKGLIDKIMPENLIKMANMLNPAVVKMLITLNEKKLIEKIGIENLTKIGQAILDPYGHHDFPRGSKEEINNVVNAWEDLLLLDEKGLIEKIETENLVKFAEAARVNVYNHLLLLNEKKIIEKIGIKNLLSIAKEANPTIEGCYSDTLSIYTNLITLEKKGLIEKIGSDNLVRLVKASPSAFFSTFEELISLLEKGTVNVEKLILITKVATDRKAPFDCARTDNAYRILLENPEFINKLGINNYAAISEFFPSVFFEYHKKQEGNLSENIAQTLLKEVKNQTDKEDDPDCLSYVCSPKYYSKTDEKFLLAAFLNTNVSNKMKEEIINYFLEKSNLKVKEENPFNESNKETYKYPNYYSLIYLSRAALTARKIGNTKVLNMIANKVAPKIIQLMKLGAPKEINQKKAFDYSYVYILYPMKLSLLQMLMDIGISNKQITSSIKNMDNINYTSPHKKENPFSVAKEKEIAIKYLLQQSQSKEFIFTPNIELWYPQIYLRP